MIQKALVVLFLLVTSLAQAADKLVGGPFAVNVGTNAATIVWVVQSTEARLGPSPENLTKEAPALRAERVGFTGLKPGTTYYYDVAGSEEGKGHFKTAPEGRASFMFIVYGDTRTRHELHQKIVDAISKTEPDFVVHTGDLVSNGKDTAMWPIFFSISKQLLNKTAFFPALGNHERNSRQFYEFFDVQTPYYSFNWGSAHFTILNSDLGNAAASKQAKETFWAEQLRWLEDDLKANQKADFRFVTMHHPPFTAVKRRQGENKPVEDMVPLFEKYNVTTVFNGHDHNYQHHIKNGVHYVVTGGGGAPLYPVDGPIPGITQKVESTEHYVDVKVNGNQAVIEAIALDGHLIDRIELGPEGAAPSGGR
jgi:predicted phosphodiesterase